MASPKFWKLAAIPLGLVLAGIPAAAVHEWLGHYVEQESVKELNVAAKRVILLTEMRLAGVIHGLDELAASGVRTCSGADRDAMNDVSFRVVPVKEVSLVDFGRCYAVYQPRASRCGAEGDLRADPEQP